MTRSTRNATRTILTATLSAALALGGVPAPALAEVTAEAEPSQTTEESADPEQKEEVAGVEQGEPTADEPGEEPNEGKADEPDAGEPTAGEPGEEPSEGKAEEPSEGKVEEPDEGKVEESNAGIADKPGAGTADEEPSEKPASTKKVEVPRAAKDLVYDGAEKVGVAAGEGYTLSGNASATAAGDYVAVATPTDGYAWADGTTDPAEVRWSIARRDAKVRADAKTKAAGEEDPELTATVEGLVEGDELEYRLTREPGEEPGEYAITPAGDAEQGSYRVSYEGAKLKVTEKAEDTALAAQAVVASGTWGTCKWQYDTNKKLTVYPGVADSASNAPWKDLRDEITSVRFASQGSSRVVLPANCASLFSGYSKLATADLYDADTSRVEDMSSMFENCPSLTALNIPYWNTSNVWNMDSMFCNCAGLGSLDLSGWDTSKVTDMDYAFSGCTSLTSLNLSGWDTTSVAYRYHMIYNCPSLQRVNVTGMRLGPKEISFHGLSKLSEVRGISGVDTSRVEDMGSMFENCPSLGSLDISHWNTSKVWNMDSMFSGCTGLGSLDLSGWDTSKVTDMDYAFSGCTSLTSLNLSGWDTTSVAYRYHMIYNCPSLQRVNVTGMRLGPKGISFHGLSKLSEVRGISGVDTSRVEDMGSMFENCPSLGSLDISHWNTSKVWNMDSMFSGCTGLGSLDLSGWDTSKVTDMDYAFSGCTSLTSLNLSGWDTTSVAYRYHMIYNCPSLQRVNVTGMRLGPKGISFYGLSKLSEVRGISGVDTSRVEDMGSMFENCPSLGSLDISHWNTSKVWNMDSMFSGCTGLGSLDLSGWDTSKVTDMDYAFNGCTSLTSLDLSGWGTSSVKYKYYMFHNCTSLARIVVGGGFSLNDAIPSYSVQGTTGWYSGALGRLLTSAEVAARKGVADVYTKKSPAGDMSCAVVAPIRARGYDGKPYTPKPKVTLCGRTLVEGTDYTISYNNNVSASNGTPATATFIGKGSCHGHRVVKFVIWKNGQPMDAWAVSRRAPAASLRTRDVTVEPPIHVAHAVSAAKPMEFRKVGGDSRLNVDLHTGRVTVRRGTPAGTYRVTIRAIAFGGSNYADGSRTVECYVQVVSGKIDQDFQASASEVSRTAASLAGSDYLTRPFSTSGAQGSVSYKRASGSGCLDVDSSGRLKVARGTKAGTYYVKAWVTSAGDAGYNTCTRTVTVKVVVK